MSLFLYCQLNNGCQLYSLPVLRYFWCIDINLLISFSPSDRLHNLAIFKTSLISLLPVFHTEEAICIIVFWGSFNYPNRYCFELFYVFRTVNLLSSGLLSRSVLLDVANITRLAFTVCVFLSLVVVNSPLSIIVSNPSWRCSGILSISSIIIISLCGFSELVIDRLRKHKGKSANTDDNENNEVDKKEFHNLNI